jgi:mannitol-1-phosphate/altronate dehydrogenase
MNSVFPTPPYHPAAMIRWWFTSPLREYNPHLFVGALFILLAGVIYYLRIRNKRKLQAEGHAQPVDEEERLFQQLMAKRKTILDKLVELEEAFEAHKLSPEEFQKQRETYKRHLVQVKLSLRQYVE